MRQVKFFCDECESEIPNTQRDKITINTYSGNDKKNPTTITVAYTPHFLHFCDSCILSKIKNEINKPKDPY